MPRVDINNATGNKNEHLTGILDELEDICASLRASPSRFAASFVYFLLLMREDSSIIIVGREQQRRAEQRNNSDLRGFLL